MSLFFILVLLNFVVLHYGKKNSDFFPKRHMLACYMLGPPTRRVVGLIPAFCDLSFCNSHQETSQIPQGN